MMTESTRICLFTGDGKGKTTAALGMAFRAAGHGMRVLVLQFIKEDASTGEIAAARTSGLIEIRQCGRGFIPPAATAAFSQHKAAAEDGLSVAQEAIHSGDYEMIVLDEICLAVARGLVAEDAVLQLINSAPVGLRLVLTGRQACPSLIATADTVTEMQCIKHGLNAGIRAMKGVEF